MVRKVALVVAGALLAGCAALAGISDAPTTSDATDDGADAASVDSARPSVDAAAPGVAPADPLVASISLTCNGTVVTKNTCPTKRWEYDFDTCLRATTRTVILRNSGAFPVAYIVRRSWSLQIDYVPNQPTDGLAGEITGVLAAGERRDISSSFDGGIALIVGSVHPFDAAALTAPLRDEGRLAYKPAMLGAFPTNGELFAAEVTAPGLTTTRCSDNSIVFKKL